ncbi:hypothetical protein IMSAGC002_00617 [Lachnospiraceae bacterium]|nr:hypothetical protein IMSAGC002_00617 [Lachnospiraceae bacterium]
MKKKTIKRILSIILTTCILGGCGLSNISETSGTNEESNIYSADESEEYPESERENTEKKTDHETNKETDIETNSESNKQILAASIQEEKSRPSLLNISDIKEEEMPSPNVMPYIIEPDLSNIDNLWQVYMEDGMKEKFIKNGFVVDGLSGSEFFQVYEWNKYCMIPNFITVDSLMHTYHLYFSHLMKNIEKNHLENNLTELSIKMAENSTKQYEALKGSEWEEAAARNVAFFSVGAKLLNAEIPSYYYAEATVSQELEKINIAEGIAISSITEDEEDYSQYIPRGYYEGDEQLESYFKAMMWYGRIHFRQDKEELDKSALLITMALAEDAESYKLWKGIYAVTSFFAGTSDDSGIFEYWPLIEAAYGKDISVNDLPNNQENFNKFHEMTANLESPKINSIPIMEWESYAIPGFRFMGQRFTIDAAIMQQLIYDNVQQNSFGDNRMLPDVLDVPAALGSDMALQILTQQGDTEYKNYSENMAKLKESLSDSNQTLWTASLYANWLNTLRPLLDKKGEGYPFFMQNEEWTKKNLECFAGSFAELKHDTVLYTKQIMAEMGWYMEEEPDDRGYVEPEPLVYSRFACLASLTADGLKKYRMLDKIDEENLMRLKEIAEKFFIISKKELQDEVLSDEEYEFIRNYGGNLEHFWMETLPKNNDGIHTQELPAAIVVDIATDPNGQILEIATGNPSTIYVAVKVDGKVKIAKGSVYSFYQFPWPIDDRLTDSKWRYMMGFQADENGNWNFGEIPINQPQWTLSYRY